MKRLFKKFLNVIKNPKILFVKILVGMKFLPDKTFLKLRYRLEFGKRLDLKNPKTFNEKLNWLKLNDRKPEYNKLVDKYLVREYIAQTIGEEYLIPLLGVWNSFEEIDFDSLPEQFVLKCTHDSGSVVICKDKNTFDYSAAKKKLSRKMKKNLYWWSREWVYKDLTPRIIAEKYMNDGAHKDVIDYKIHCFNGEPKFVLVCDGRFSIEGITEDFYDTQWSHIEVKRPQIPNKHTLHHKPEKLDEMLAISKILSKDLRFSRVDFYIFQSKVYFGEITFFPAAGMGRFVPEEWDLKFGEWIDLGE